MSTPSAADRSILRMHRVLRPGFGTEAAVYGTILVSGLVAVSSAHGETSGVVLLTVAITVLVFWGAHVYAGTVARLAEVGEVHDEAHPGLRRAFGQSVRHSFGMLSAAAIPCLVLAAGILKVVPDVVAIDIALWSGVVILALLGYVAFLRRGSAFWVRLLGALATASFGVVFVLLKAFVH